MSLLIIREESGFLRATRSIPTPHAAGNNAELLARSCTEPFLAVLSPLCYKGFSFVYSFLKSPKESVSTRHQQKQPAEQEQCVKWAIPLQDVPELAVAEPKTYFGEQGTEGQRLQAAKGQTRVHPKQTSSRDTQNANKR